MILQPDLQHNTIRTRIVKWESCIRMVLWQGIPKHGNIPYPLYPPLAGVGSSKKLARRHASENLLARMEEEGMNTNPSLIKPKRKVCTVCIYVSWSQSLNSNPLCFFFLLRNHCQVPGSTTLLEADVWLQCRHLPTFHLSSSTLHLSATLLHTHFCTTPWWLPDHIHMQVILHDSMQL